MRSWVFSAWLTAPVWTKRTRLRARTGACGRAARQMASRRAVTWSTAVPRASAAAMPSLISRSYSCRSGSWLSSTLAPGGISVGAAGRGLATVPAARSGSAAGRALAVVPGCDRAWAWVIACALGGDAEELVQVLAGDQVSSADFDVGQV